MEANTSVLMLATEITIKKVESVRIPLTVSTNLFPDVSDKKNTDGVSTYYSTDFCNRPTSLLPPTFVLLSLNENKIMINYNFISHPIFTILLNFIALVSFLIL